MATVIRFSRHGTKKKPFFRIVVQDHRAPRDGRFIENIGFFSPTKGLPSLNVERERLDYWTSVGARMSNSVRNRLKLGMKPLEQKEVDTAATTVVSKKKPKKSVVAKEA